MNKKEKKSGFRLRSGNLIIPSDAGSYGYESVRDGHAHFRKKGRSEIHTGSMSEFSNDHLFSIIEGSSDHISALDPDYRFISFNSAYKKKFREFFGRDIHQGLCLLDLLRDFPDILQMSKANWDRVFKGEEFISTYSLEFNKTVMHMEAKFSPIRNSGNQVTGGTCIVRDVTRREKLQEELHQAHQLLEAKVVERTAELERVNDQLRREIEERAQAEKLLLLTKKRLMREKNIAEGIINSLPGIFYIFDKDGKLYKWNHNLEKITGYAADEIQGKSILRLFDVRDVASVKKAIRKTFSGSEVDVEASLVSKDGKKTPYYFTGTSIDYDGQQYMMGMALDITERKEAENAIRLYARKLKKLNVSKDKFFSIIAHDLRSPFTGLMGLSDLLVNEFDDLPNEKVRDYAGKINTSSKNVFRLLNNLLEWSRIQLNGTELKPEQINMHELVHSNCETLQDIFKAKNIDLKIEVEPSLELHADRNMLGSVLQNLISNSLKFSRNFGEIVIKAAVQNDQILVSITDTGVGMSKKMLERLFLLEKNISTKGTNNEQGSGMGLILCKEFIGKHGGEIWATSKEGKGSTFWFTLSRNRLTGQPTG
ncbi:MAG: PAS domain S-box protein [Balneolales bacterium]